MPATNAIWNAVFCLVLFLIPFFDLFSYANGTSNTSVNSTLSRDWSKLKKSSDDVSDIPMWVNGSRTQLNGGQGRRDFVNPNISSTTPRPNQKQLNTHFITSQRNEAANVNSRRDYVNTNPNRPQTGHNTQQNIHGGQQLNSDQSAWPQLGGRRDFVNTNPPPTWVRPTTPTSTRNPSQAHNNRNPNVNPNTRRDYVNPNVKPQTNPHRTNANNNKNVQFIQNSNTLSKPGTNFVGSPANNNEPAVKNIQQSEDEELREFSEALLRKDTNNAANFITINYQSKTTSRSLVDEAPLPLLTLKPEVFNISTIAQLIPLHNNYILQSNENEHVTPQEKSEENSLLDAILTTSVMQHTRNFLIQKGKIGKDPKEFRDLLKQIWFNMYSRGGGKIGSSGFEHVFLVEIKNGTLSGLHNWLYFNMQELANKANYLGYMKKIDLNNKGAIIKYHFKFGDIDKPVASMFIGTSPELEIALYSTCFLLRPNAVCPLRFDGNNFIIRTYTYRYRGKNLIGSAFPEI